MIKRFFKELLDEIVDVSLTLFKIMIPAIVIVKLLELVGATTYIAMALAPLMQFVGLPESMGIVWATTMLTNIYAGLLVFADISAQNPLTTAQVSVLGGLMLLAHSLPVEVAIAKKAGVRIWVILLLRIGGGLLFGWLLFMVYSHGSLSQQHNELAWLPEANKNTGLIGWGIEQTKNLLIVQLVIVALLLGLKLLKIVGIEKLMTALLKPILMLLGIGRQASTLTIIGITLGLSYGGGLLINEAKRGHISARDVCAAILLLSLFHSVIEDTLLILLLGADIHAILSARLLFAFITIAILTRLMASLGEPFCKKYVYQSVSGTSVSNTKA